MPDTGDKFPTEEQMDLVDNRFCRSLEETADAAFCVSQQGDICTWNSAAEQLFGYSASEAIGKSCHGLLQCRGSLGAKLCTSQFYARHATEEHCRIPNFDLEVTVRSGRRIWVDLSTLVFKGGRTHPRLIAHLSRDITERKHNEELLHKMLQLSKEIIAVSNGNGIGRPAPVCPLPNRSKAYFAYFRMARILPTSPRNLGSACKHSAIIFTMSTTSLEHMTGFSAVMHAMHRKLI
jgi:PAS domain S-box-containing protein